VLVRRRTFGSQNIKELLNDVGGPCPAVLLPFIIKTWQPAKEPKPGKQRPHIPQKVKIRLFPGGFCSGLFLPFSFLAFLFLTVKQ
jgi:hypothetical protein